MVEMGHKDSAKQPGHTQSFIAVRMVNSKMQTRRLIKFAYACLKLRSLYGILFEKIKTCVEFIQLEEQ